jgi:acetyl-CoA synthetase
MKAVWNNKARFDSYFAIAGYYLSGDSAYMDEEGYVFFQGRGDDLITASGEKVSPFEVESTLIEHPAVAEAGVIGKPDPLRGSVVKAFILLRDGVEPSRELGEEIKRFVKTRLSAHAYPKEIEILEELPKTRVSGKIMRRVLVAWETGQDVGDTTTLEGGVRMTRLVV